MFAMPHEDKRRKKATTTYGKAHRRRGPAYLAGDHTFTTELQSPLPVTPRSSSLVNGKRAKVEARIGDKPPTPPKDIFDFDSDAEKTPPLPKIRSIKRKGTELERPDVKRKLTQKLAASRVEEHTETAVSTVRVPTAKTGVVEEKSEKGNLALSARPKVPKVYGKPKTQSQDSTKSQDQATIAAPTAANKGLEKILLGPNEHSERETPQINREEDIKANDKTAEPLLRRSEERQSPANARFDEQPTSSSPSTPPPSKSNALSLLITSEIKRRSAVKTRSRLPELGKRDSRRLGRRRLIDSLSASAARRSESEDEKSDADTDKDVRAEDITQPAAPSALLIRQPSQTGGMALAPAGVPAAGIRVTYSRQRSMLSEQNDLLDIDSGAAQRRNMANFMQMRHDLAVETTADAAQTGPAIRSVHELRQAGATTRFLDEIDDLGDRICESAKSSGRRSGLVELLGKMHEKSFLQNLLTSGVHEKVIKSCLADSDNIVSFLLVGILTVLLNSNAKVSADLLQSSGLFQLLTRMLAVDTGIVSLGKQRRSNMSPVAVTKLNEEQQRLQGLSVWSDEAPDMISPLSIALACISLILRAECNILATSTCFRSETIAAVFGILESYSKLDLGFLATKKSGELHLIITIISTSYIVLMANESGSEWGAEYLTTIRSIARCVLDTLEPQLESLRPLVLSLVLNITNSNVSASAVFASSDFIPLLIRKIVGSYRDSAIMITDESRMAHIDSLVLMLGIMINLAEQMDDSKSRIVHAADLRDLLQIFTVTAEKAAEVFDLHPLKLVLVSNKSQASSVEDTHLNVTVGYLAVFLGYLALQKSLAQVVRSGLPGGTLRLLIAAIEEFIRHHRKVDAMSGDDDRSNSAHAGLTQRLTRLLTKAREVEDGFSR